MFAMAAMLGRHMAQLKMPRPDAYALLVNRLNELLDVAGRNVSHWSGAQHREHMVCQRAGDRLQCSRCPSRRAVRKPGTRYGLERAQRLSLHHVLGLFARNAGVDAGSHQLTCLSSPGSGQPQRDFRVRAERQQLFLPLVAVLEPPPRPAVRSDFDVQTVAVKDALRLFSRAAGCEAWCRLAASGQLLKPWG